MSTHAHPEASADHAAESRARILDAALQAFSTNGLAGARTEQIATAAGVNKALLYYYFGSKEDLYLAALELAANRVRETMAAVFTLQASAGERVLRAALNHFDRILTQREFQSLMQQEMVRMHAGKGGALSVLIDRVFGPVQALFQNTIREGIASGELVDADWLQIQLAALGSNVFYFLSAPIWRTILPFEPFSEDALRARRTALVSFLAQAVFQDRQHGAELARKVLADTPAPPSADLYAGICKRFEVKKQ